MARRYELRERARGRERTRQRIVDAAIELHQTVGPAATTMTDVAGRAGVGRVTVYRHFPDELALARACSGHYFERHPLPDPERWRAIADPQARLRAGLAETLAYHRATEPMMARVLADAADHPVVAPYHEHWRRAAGVLAAGFRARGRQRVLLRAAIGLALTFGTWRELARGQGLDDDQALEVLLRLAGARAPARAVAARRERV